MRSVGLLLLICGCLLFAGCSLSTGSAVSAPGMNPDEASTTARLGIEVQSLRQTANGYMLDFRYRVLDSDKAQPLADRKVPVTLLHEASGARFAVPSSPKVGPMRQTVRNAKPEVGRVYFIMFANPAGYVKPGDLVTISVGDEKIPHLVVQ